MSPYLIHLYSKFECLRNEEIQQLEVAKEYLVLGVAPEKEPDADEESNRSSLSLEAKQRVPGTSPRPQLKMTFRSPKGKEPIRSPECKNLGFLDLDDRPFQRAQEELDRIQNNYSKMEVVLRGASRLLGDFKVGNIRKEIWKLKEEETSELKAHNTTLKKKINDLKATMQVQDAEVRRLRTKIEGIERIRAFLSNS